MLQVTSGVIGLRPIEIWVPDTRQPNFITECQRQSALVAQADLADTDLYKFLKDALANQVE